MSEYIVDIANATVRRVKGSIEIVRCRDCRHYEPEYSYLEDVDGFHSMVITEPPCCKGWDCQWEGHTVSHVTDPNGYCWKAERKAVVE